MCGICGQCFFDKSRMPNNETIKSMSDALYNRGPDDEGYYFTKGLGFGFRRLSIIDLDGGHQPMSNHDKSIWLVFNGEIYNYLELRKELEKAGHIFKSKSDTEVIIHGYKEWGDDVLNHLNGMFGLAIWDQNKQKMIIARDPMGIKLLYYYLCNDGLVFASEIRPILNNIQDTVSIDTNALNMFLLYRYVPSPYTLFKKIKKLAPGTMLTVENGEATIRRWYKYIPKPFDPMPTANEAKEELLGLYKDAVKRQLIADVPVGLLLSGGIDSGLLLGLMNLYGNNWRTYTIGYGDSYIDDELKDAMRTAEIFSSKHESIMINKQQFENILPEIVSHLEEPVASSSIVPMFLICNRIKQDIKVALTGQGPDELFGGYKRHLGVNYGHYYRKLPNYLRKNIEMFIEKMPRNETLKRGSFSIGIDDKKLRFLKIFSIVPDNMLHELSLYGSDSEILTHKIFECWKPIYDQMIYIDELNSFQLIELRSSLPDELLLYTDKLSMANSIEVRVPYLDKHVVEFSQSLKATYKIHFGKRKWLHNQVCKDVIPKEIIKRKKRGFGVNVVDKWFRESIDGHMNEIIYDKNSKIYRYFDKVIVQDILHQHISGKNDYHKLLFSLIIMEIWFNNLSI